MTTIVFVGPSIPVADARGILDAIYLPPVQQGDLLSAISTHAPDVIGVLDGEFSHTLSVWHKEFLYALHRGIHVFGASSMGALRAAETDMYGTVGVGDIYRMYADGVLTDDDEVALAHGTAESGYRALSDPLVNIRATLAAAVSAKVIGEELAERLIAGEKAVFFPERSYHHLLETAADAGEDRVVLERLREFVRTSRVDLKRADAVTLLETIRDLPRPLAPHVPTFEFKWSGNFRALYDQDRKVPVAGQDTAIALSAVGTYLALHAPDFNALNGQALDRSLVEVLAEMLGVEASPEEAAAERRRFKVEHRLASDDALADWQRSNHLAEDEFETLMRQLARRRTLHRWFTRRRSYIGTTRSTLDELRLRGDYLEWLERANTHEELASSVQVGPDAALDTDEADDERLSDIELAVEHMRATECRMPIAYRKWAEEAGVLDGRRLRVDLLRARAARREASRLLDRLADVSQA